MKSIVILGAGYGGLITATTLQKIIFKNEATITLVNKNDYHYETTWLHETSAGTIDKERATYPIIDVLDKEKVQFIKDTVIKINKEEKTVQLKNQTISYDYLVIALGFESATFGIKGIDKYAHSIIDINSAIRIKEDIESKIKSLKNTDKDLHIVVGGCGFTGVEFLGELVHKIPQLCNQYNVDNNKIHISCIEAGERPLPQFDEDLVDYALNQLKDKGVTFRLGTAVKEVTEEKIKVSKNELEEVLPYDIFVWSAGVQGNSIIAESGFEQKRNRIAVNSYLQVPNYEDIFVVGDCSFLIDETTNRPLPTTAQLATQQGKNCAENLALLIRGNNDLKKFKFSNKGTVCSIGNSDGIGVVMGKKIKGTPAAFMKKVVDNRSLFIVGGFSTLMKKGKF